MRTGRQPRTVMRFFLDCLSSPSLVVLLQKYLTLGWPAMLAHGQAGLHVPVPRSKLVRLQPGTDQPRPTDALVRRACRLRVAKHRPRRRTRIRSVPSCHSWSVQCTRALSPKKAKARGPASARTAHIRTPDPLADSTIQCGAMRLRHRRGDGATAPVVCGRDGGQQCGSDGGGWEGGSSCCWGSWDWCTPFQSALQRC